jgi:hypothetical protein
MPVDVASGTVTAAAGATGAKAGHMLPVAASQLGNLDAAAASTVQSSRGRRAGRRRLGGSSVSGLGGQVSASASDAHWHWHWHWHWQSALQPRRFGPPGPSPGRRGWKPH